jgi:predicted DNA-binding protein
VTDCGVAETPPANDERGETAMARKKISTTIYITPEQNEQLKVLHERTKVPIAVFIREGIDLVLERHRDHLPGQLTLDVSEAAPKR